MAVKSGFFMSVNGDRRYDAAFFAEYFASFIGNGIFPNPSTNLQVVEGNNMQTVVKPGKGWINGYYVHNDSDFILQHDVADGALKRIDRIVLQWNYLTRKIEIVLKKGAFASSPVAPALVRNTDYYELALADVLINNGATQITQANITDTRLNKALCGIVHGTVDQVDTTTLFNQYQSWIVQQKAAYETDFTTWSENERSAFDTWVQSIQDILSGDIAGNLQIQITNIDQKVATHHANKANPHNVTSQQVNEITSMLVTDSPSTYPRGVSVFQLTTTTSAPWRDSVGNIGQTTNYAVVETIKMATYSVQRITFIYTADGSTKGTWQREGNSASAWRKWRKVLNQDDYDQLFQFANDGKTSVANAVTAKGVAASPSDTFSQLVTKIGQIETGKKYASGTVTSGNSTTGFEYAGTTSKTNRYYITVTGLSFKPKKISLYANSGGNRLLVDYSEGNDFYYPKTVKSSAYSDTSHTPTTYNCKADVLPATVHNTGFTLPVNAPSTVFTWEAWGE